MISKVTNAMRRFGRYFIEQQRKLLRRQFREGLTWSMIILAGVVMMYLMPSDPTWQEFAGYLFVLFMAGSNSIHSRSDDE